MKRTGTPRARATNEEQLSALDYITAVIVCCVSCRSPARFELMPKNIFRYADSSITGLKPILEGWIAAQRKYIRQTKDYSWCYRERPCVGFLAGGAWLAGGGALEEWRTDKRRDRDVCKGRCDLYIYRKRWCFHLEAKHVWLPGTQTETTARSVRKELDRAMEAARQLICEEELRLGILFIAPYFRPKEQNGITARVKEWRKEIEKVQHDAIAWIFRRRLPTERERGQNFCPGIVLIARQV